MYSNTSFALSLLITVFALVAVLALAWLSIKAFASVSKSNLKGGRIKLLQSLPLGSRERLALIRLDDKELLIGVTASGITLLTSQTPAYPETRVADKISTTHAD